MTDEKPKDIPMGEKIRNVLNPLLENEVAHEVIYGFVDRYFASLADQLPAFYRQKLQPFFTAAAKKDPNEQAEAILRGITFVSSDREDSKPIQLILPLPLEISNHFTNFTAEEVRSMAGFIKLHELARDMDFAIRVTGLTAEDKNAGHTQVVLYSDFSLSYAEGLMRNPRMNPDLPEKEEVKKTNTPAPEKNSPPPAGSFKL